MEIHGAKALKKHFPQGNFVFILPPTSKVLENRLRDRGSLPEAELQQRLDRVRQEVQEAAWYDYLIINDELPVAIRQLQAIVITARCRTPCYLAGHQTSLELIYYLSQFVILRLFVALSFAIINLPQLKTVNRISLLAFTLTPCAKPGKKSALLES